MNLLNQLFLEGFTEGSYKTELLKYFSYNRWTYFDQVAEKIALGQNYTANTEKYQKQNSGFIIYGITRASYSEVYFRKIMEGCRMHPFKSIVFFLKEETSLFTIAELRKMNILLHEKPKDVPLTLDILNLVNLLIQYHTDINTQDTNGYKEGCRNYRWSGNEFYASPHG
jgi:hypothetical protein